VPRFLERDRPQDALLYIFSKHWLPDARLESGENPKYAGWHRDGWIESGGIESNDYDLVEDEIRADATKFQIVEVCYDPWQAHEMVTHLQGRLPMVQIDQSTKNLSDPMRELESAIYDGRFHYPDDPVLNWAISNVVVKFDKNDNMFPTKESAGNKIDPITAVITAFVGVARYAKLAAAGSGVTSFGNCSKCGEMCVGKLIGDKMQYLCKKHEESHGK
jgi:phage terminase large subunit-like protein